VAFGRHVLAGIGACDVGLYPLLGGVVLTDGDLDEAAVYTTAIRPRG
jgi:hypothetical protein